MEVSTKAHIIDSFPSPTVEEVKDFESRNRIVLPEQYVKFLLASNGGSCNGGDALVGGIGGYVFALQHMYALNAPYEYFDLQDSVNAKNIMYPKYRKFLPIGIDPFGNEFCMRASNREKSDVWLLDFETADNAGKACKGPDWRLKIRSLGEVLTWLIRGLLGGVGLVFKTLTKAVPFSYPNF